MSVVVTLPEKPAVLSRMGWTAFVIALIVVCAVAPLLNLVVPKDSGMWQKGILVAVDGSRHADAAAVAAGMLAKHCGLPLTVLAVCASDDLKCDMVKPLADRVRDLLRHEGVPADSAVAEGKVADAIVQAAKDHDCDLIVVGSHGRTGLDRILMGSVSQQVVIQAQCPVMVVTAG